LQQFTSRNAHNAISLFTQEKMKSSYKNSVTHLLNNILHYKHYTKRPYGPKVPLKPDDDSSTCWSRVDTSVM